MTAHQTLETVLCEAVDRLRSPRGLDIPRFVQEHPEHAEELRELLPALVSMGRERLNRAIDQGVLVAACELFRGGDSPCAAPTAPRSSVTASKRFGTT